MDEVPALHSLDADSLVPLCLDASVQGAAQHKHARPFRACGNMATFSLGRPLKVAPKGPCDQHGGLILPSE